MTAVLGSTACPVLGCHRERHVSPSGIHYGTCLAHATALLSRAFSGRDFPPSAGLASPRGHGARRAVVASPTRFWAKVQKTPGCWEWTGDKDRDGYGRFWFAGRKWMAHRVAYELMRAAIPDGLQVDHLCRNRACVNPTHLEAVPQRVNTLRGFGAPAQNARKSHCTNGHLFDADNTRLKKVGTATYRICRACARAEARSRYHAARGAVDASAGG